MKIKFSLKMPGRKTTPDCEITCDANADAWTHTAGELADSAVQTGLSSENKELIGHLPRIDKSLVDDFLSGI